MGIVEPVLSASGLAFLLSYADIFSPLRRRFSILECPLCTGFHLGYLMYYAWIPASSLLEAFLAAILSSIGGLALLRFFDL